MARGPHSTLRPSPTNNKLPIRRPHLVSRNPILTYFCYLTYLIYCMDITVDIVKLNDDRCNRFQMVTGSMVPPSIADSTLYARGFTPFSRLVDEDSVRSSLQPFSPIYWSFVHPPRCRPQGIVDFEINFSSLGLAVQPLTFTQPMHPVL